MLSIAHRENSELSQDEIVAAVSLVNTIWPHKEKTVSELVEGFRAAHLRYRASYPQISRSAVRYLAWDDEQLVGHAFTFERPMISAGVEMSVMALAGVCVAPAYRGRRIGVELVRRAFERVSAEFPVALFQTTIPDFYQRRGARVVQNRFFNSRNEADPDASPWSHGWMMIYPGEYAWPEGPVDLNGPGY